MNKINELISIHSFGIHTISDNCLIKIKDNLIAFSFEGNIIIYDIENEKEQKTFLSPSMIKTINILDENNLLITCETGDIFIFDYIKNQIINKCKIKGITNLFFTSINKDYVLICHHSILDENNEYNIIHNKDGITLINYKNNFEVLWTKKSENVYAILNNDNKVVCIYYSEGKNYLILYNEKGEIILEKKIEQIKYNIKRLKKLSQNLIICETNKRYLYVIDIDNINVLNEIYLEGNGELGEFTIEDLNNIIIPNKFGQFIIININKIKKEEIISKDAKSYFESDIIRGYNWGILSISKYYIIVNETGFYKLNKETKEYIYKKNILEISGCGVSNPKNNSNIFCYGDLKGNLIIFDNKKFEYKEINIGNEMIRSISNDNISNFIIGTMSGNIYQYNYIEKNKPKLIIPKDGNGSITCIHFYNDYLIISTTDGFIKIYDKNTFNLIYFFKAHLEQKNNKNNSFGSLHLKSEIWSFDIYTKSKLNDEKNFYISTGSEDQTIKIHVIKINNNNNLSHELIKEIKDNKFAVTCIIWNIMNNKEIILSCSDDHTINLYDPNLNFENILKVDFSNIYYGFFTLTYCAIDNNNPSNKYIVIGTQVGFLIIYDIIKNKIIFHEKIHYGGIEGLSFSNNTISTCSNDCSFSILIIHN